MSTIYTWFYSHLYLVLIIWHFTGYTWCLYIYIWYSFLFLPFLITSCWWKTLLLLLLPRMALGADHSLLYIEFTKGTFSTAADWPSSCQLSGHLRLSLFSPFWLDICISVFRGRFFHSILLYGMRSAYAIFPAWWHSPRQQFKSFFRLYDWTGCSPILYYV